MEDRTLEEVEGDGGDGDVVVAVVGEGASGDGEGVAVGVGNPNNHSSSRGGAEVVVEEPYSISNWHNFEVGIYLLVSQEHLWTDKIT